MKNTQMAASLINAQANLVARALDNGYLRIYDGAQPTNADGAVTTQTVLAELRFAATSAPSASSGVLSFSALAAVIASASGTASWFRCLSSDGATKVMDGSLGLSGDDPNLILSTVTIVAGGSVSISSFTHSVAGNVTGL